MEPLRMTRAEYAEAKANEPIHMTKAEYADAKQTEDEFDYTDPSNYSKAAEGVTYALFGDDEGNRSPRNLKDNLVAGAINFGKETGANTLDMLGAMLPVGESNTQKLFGKSDELRSSIPDSSIGKLVGDVAAGGVVGSGAKLAIDNTASLVKKARLGGKHGDSILNVLSNAEAALIPGKTVAGARKGVAGVDNIIDDISMNKYQGIKDVPANTGASEAVIRRGLKGTPNAAIGSDIGGTVMKLVERATGGNSPYTQELASQAIEVARTTGLSIDDSLAIVMKAWRKKAEGKTTGEEITKRLPAIGAATGALLGGSTAN